MAIFTRLSVSFFLLFLVTTSSKSTPTQVAVSRYGSEVESLENRMAPSNQSSAGIEENQIRADLTSRVDSPTTDFGAGYNYNEVKPWEYSIQYGNKLLCAMNQPADAESMIVDQSPWTDWESTKKYGWTMNKKQAMSNRFSDDFEQIQGMRAAFEDLKISIDPEDKVWWTVGTKHAYAVEEHGETIYPATRGSFYNWYNPSQGAIMARYNWSPALRAKQRGITKLPPLQKWSDLVYLTWQMMTTETERRHITHVFRHDIVNRATRESIRRAKGDGTTDGIPYMPPKWPGWKFTPEHPDFKSILSTAHTYGVAYLLATHKAEDRLGVRIIDRIHVFNCPRVKRGEDTVGMWCMYLHIREGPVELDDATGAV